MENRTYDAAMQGGFLQSFAAANGLARNYHGVSHPSLPNYLAMTSGDTHGITDDGYHALPPGGIGAQLTAAGLPWRAYMESMQSKDCFGSGYPYALKHNPFAYYGGDCPDQVRPLTEMAGDLAGPVPPRFVWITPDLCHDGHDCPTQTADDWLRQEVAAITGSRLWVPGAVLFVTWDEDDGTPDNHIVTVVAEPGLGARTSDRRYDHYSLLATIEDLLGLSRLGQAASAPTMADLLGP